MMGLDLLFAPRSIALVGAAHEESKLGGVILKNLLKFRGTVFPVNPKYDELQGLKTYPDVRAIPDPVDLAVIMRPAQEVPGILRDLEGKAVFAVLMSSGFAEIGEAALQEEVGRAGRDSGIRLLGPNCMGIFNPHRRLDTFFLPAWRLFSLTILLVGLHAIILRAFPPVGGLQYSMVHGYSPVRVPGKQSRFITGREAVLKGWGVVVMGVVAGAFWAVFAYAAWTVNMAILTPLITFLAYALGIGIAVSIVISIFASIFRSVSRL